MKQTPETPSSHSVFATREAKIDLTGVRLTGQTRMKIQKVLEEQEKGHLLRAAGFKPRYRLLFYGAAGTGKAQPLDAQIAVPDGWKTMGEIKLNDLVMTPDGGVAPVKGIFPVGRKEIIEVTLIDGRRIECCDGHLWKAHCDEWRRVKRKEILLPRKEGNKTGWRTVETKELLELQAKRKKLDIALPLPIIDYPETQLPIDAYWLGAMLGDGDFTNHNLNFSNTDEEVLRKLQASSRPDYEMGFRGGCTWGITQKGKQKGNPRSPYRRLLRELGLDQTDCFTKFIPPIYLLGSRKQRLQLLEGLLDTDGEVDKGGCIIFATSSEKLRDDTQRLCWSLGYMCSIGEKIPTYTYKGKKLKGAKAYRLYIRANSPRELNLMERKRARIREDGQYNGCIRAEISWVRRTGKFTEMQCIWVDHPEHLYITNDYVVTHNTMAAEGIAHYLSRKLHVFNLESLSGTDPDEAMKSVMDGLRLMNEMDDVFLFDEFDAIASHRSATSAGAAARQTSNALLIAFEQIKSNAILICATNFLSTIDPAFRRRFDTICKFELPDITEREAILRMALGRFKMQAPDEDIREAALRTEGLSYHETEELALAGAKTAVLKKSSAVNLMPEVPAALERRMAFKQLHDA